MKRADWDRARVWANELDQLIRNAQEPGEHRALHENIRYLAGRLAGLNFAGASCLEVMTLAEPFYGQGKWMHSRFPDAASHHAFMSDCVKKLHAALDAQRLE